MPNNTLRITATQFRDHSHRFNPWHANVFKPCTKAIGNCRTTTSTRTIPTNRNNCCYFVYVEPARRAHLKAELDEKARAGAVPFAAFLKARKELPNIPCESKFGRIRQMRPSMVFDERVYGSVISLGAGMILMFLGFFMYLGGESQIISVALMLAGAICEFLGFLLAYLAYRTSIHVQGFRGHA